MSHALNHPEQYWTVHAASTGTLKNTSNTNTTAKKPGKPGKPLKNHVPKQTPKKASPQKQLSKTLDLSARAKSLLKEFNTPHVSRELFMDYLVHWYREHHSTELFQNLMKLSISNEEWSHSHKDALPELLNIEEATDA